MTPSSRAVRALGSPEPHGATQNPFRETLGSRRVARQSHMRGKLYIYPGRTRSTPHFPGATLPSRITEVFIQRVTPFDCPSSFLPFPIPGFATKVEVDGCPVAALIRARRSLLHCGMEEWYAVTTTRRSFWLGLIEDMPSSGEDDWVSTRRARGGVLSLDNGDSLEFLMRET